jgi:endonuclease G
MRADLTKKASLNTMVRLSTSAAEGLEGLERAGHEPETAAEEFEGREGYDPSFLDGFNITLPLGTGSAKNDMLTIGGGPDVELKYMHFSVIMSVARRMPMLTVVNIDASQSRRLPRISTWSFDGRIEKNHQFGDALYDNNALDRGHMVRREDPVWGSLEEAKTANEDTFHFTNSCPQMAGVNQQTWLSLENYILQHARADKMRVTVFTGPFFSEDDLEYRDARVPAAFWKVVAIVTDDGRPSATAYKVSQARELAELEFVFAGFKTYQISIQQVMKATDLDFSHLLEFDGFSQHESVTGVEMVEQLDDLALIRI